MERGHPCLTEREMFILSVKAPFTNILAVTLVYSIFIHRRNSEGKLYNFVLDDQRPSRCLEKQKPHLSYSVLHIRLKFQDLKYYLVYFCL